MEKISFFLERFKTLGLDSLLIKQVFVDVVKKNLNIILPLEDLDIKNGVVSVRAHSALKSELRIKKTVILEEVSKILGPTKISALR
ncbi:MAG: hypothetical protein EXS46_03075 [Candidatus Taylorbacteria bacterium]|nr:hypothetical protein [Candidatus Taylorbacteria bacterium]